jgi:tetratricopeptide (TPR) repeat protein
MVPTAWRPDAAGEAIAMADLLLARSRWRWRPWRWLALAAWAAVGAGAAPGGTARSGIGDSGAAHQQADLLLDEYFRLFLADRDFEAFRDRVAARYGEEALCRLAAESPGAATRRAAVLALGTLGSFPRSNPVLGRALRDPDPVARRLAEDALWSLWFRADTPEHNRALRQVVQVAGQGEMNRAEALATRLIVLAPGFAEAYNQRAIIYFEQGRFAESARDCQRVLSVNRYHFGAMGGLAQCQLRLNQPSEAIKTLRRALKLQPYNVGLRESLKFVEARVALDESR